MYIFEKIFTVITKNERKSWGIQTETVLNSIIIPQNVSKKSLKSHQRQPFHPPTPNKLNIEFKVIYYLTLKYVVLFFFVQFLMNMRRLQRCPSRIALRTSCLETLKGSCWLLVRNTLQSYFKKWSYGIVYITQPLILVFSHSPVHKERSHVLCQTSLQINEGMST